MLKSNDPESPLKRDADYELSDDPDAIPQGAFQATLEDLDESIAEFPAVDRLITAAAASVESVGDAISRTAEGISKRGSVETLKLAAQDIASLLAGGVTSIKSTVTGLIEEEDNKSDLSGSIESNNSAEGSPAVDKAKAVGQEIRKSIRNIGGWFSGVFTSGSNPAKSPFSDLPA